MLKSHSIIGIVFLLFQLCLCNTAFGHNENATSSSGFAMEKCKFVIYNPYLFKMTTVTIDGTTIDSCIEWDYRLQTSKQKTCFTRIVFLREEDEVNPFVSILPFNKAANKGTFSGKFSDDNNWRSLNMVPLRN